LLVGSENTPTTTKSAVSTKYLGEFFKLKDIKLAYSSTADWKSPLLSIV